MCSFERTVYSFIFLDSSMVEHSAVNRVVVGSSPTRGVFFFLGSMVKRLRHRPFTAVTRVQIPLESFLAQQCAELKVISRMPMWLNWQSSWFVISRLSVRVRSSAFLNLFWELKWVNFILNVLNGQIPEWPKGTDCKSAAICFGGSNPPLPILFSRD